MEQSLGASVGGPSWRCWVVVMLLTSSSAWKLWCLGALMHCVGDGSFSDHSWRPGMCATGVDCPCTRSNFSPRCTRGTVTLHLHLNFNLNIDFNLNQLPPQPACLELIALCFYASLFGSKRKYGYQSPKPL